MKVQSYNKNGKEELLIYVDILFSNDDFYTGTKFSFGYDCDGYRF